MSRENRYDFKGAWRSLRVLLKKPNDLTQVFMVVDALQGDVAEALLARLQRTAQGRTLLQTRPNIVPLLTDRAALLALPAGSLGRAYLAFLDAEGIGVMGLLLASRRAARTLPEDEFRWQSDRLRDTHDLWHTVTGYQGDLLGELGLLAFFLGQQWHPGVALIVAGGLARGLSRELPLLIANAYVRGKRSAWLLEQPWEALLALPLTEVRQRLGLQEPPGYRPVR